MPRVLCFAEGGFFMSSKKTSTSHNKKQNNSVRPVRGVCHICGEKDAKFRCMQCHTPVCDECFFHLVGLCKNCVSKPVAKKWKKQKPNWEKKLGVEWID